MRKPKHSSDTTRENGFSLGPPSSDRGAQRVRELDAQALLHELRVHQFELEIQNEELRRARSEMEIALRIYTEIFDFSPIGYATLQDDHVIANVNLAGSEILGRPRTTLNGMAFERLVSYPQRMAFGALISAARSSGERRTSHLELLRGDGELVSTRLSAIPLLRAEPTLLIAIELTRALAATTH
jgi:PAS domain S-box-containing protein